MTKYEQDWIKIVDFLLLANFLASPIFLHQSLDFSKMVPKVDRKQRHLVAYIHDFLVIVTLMTVYKTVSHHNGPFSTASKHKNEKVLIHMR